MRKSKAGRISRLKMNDENIKQNGTKKRSNDVPIVGIGGSAGSIESLKKFLNNVPRSSGFAYIIVLHLNPDQESLLADVLSNFSTMDTEQIKDNTIITANKVYVIPPNKNIEIHNRMIKTSEFEKPRGSRHPIDHFFQSLANAQKEKAIGIIFSGTGSDGVLGLRYIKGNNGLTFTETIGSAKYPDMPRNALKDSHTDFTLQPEDIPGYILKIKEIDTKLTRQENGEFPDDLYAILLEKVHRKTGDRKSVV